MMMHYNRWRGRQGSYRLRLECQSCPNTAWLLFLLFAIAIIAASAAAMYLSKTKINFAGLGIGVVRVLERSS